MKKLMIVFMCLFCLTGCSLIKESNKYFAVGLDTTNDKSSCSMSFDSFNGTYVLEVKKKSTFEGAIKFKARLQSGSITVSYRQLPLSDVKQPLLEISSNQYLNDVGGYVEGKGTIYIIIESNGDCKKGSFTFEVD